MRWSRREKNLVRQLVCKYRQPYYGVVDIPGEQALSTKMLIKNKCISDKTTVILIEKKQRIARKIKYLETNGNCVILTTPLVEATIPIKVDFANIDLCGCPSSEIFHWASGLNYSKGARIYFTFTPLWRNYTRGYNYLAKLSPKKLLKMWDNLHPTELSRWPKSDILNQTVLGTWMMIYEYFGQNIEITSSYFYKDGLPMNLFGIKIK